MIMRSLQHGLGVMAAMITMIVLIGCADVSGQTRKRRKAVRPVPVATPSIVQEPLIISRAEDFPDENRAIAIPAPTVDGGRLADDPNARSIDELRARLELLESTKSKDSDQKQKRLLMYLDILTKAEQRAESLRKQNFELIEKEATIRNRLDGIEGEIRPESIEKNVAMAGSLRPEELREIRRRSLTAERNNLQTLLTEIQRTRNSIESTLVRADAMVERMRSRLEKDIDDAMSTETETKRPDQ